MKMTVSTIYGMKVEYFNIINITLKKGLYSELVITFDNGEKELISYYSKVSISE